MGGTDFLIKVFGTISVIVLVIALLFLAEFTGSVIGVGAFYSILSVVIILAFLALLFFLSRRRYKKIDIKKLIEESSED